MFSLRAFQHDGGADLSNHFSHGRSVDRFGFNTPQGDLYKSHQRLRVGIGGSYGRVQDFIEVVTSFHSHSNLRGRMTVLLTVMASNSGHIVLSIRVDKLGIEWSGVERR